MLFLVGGSLLAGHAAISGLNAFTDLATPPDVFVTTGHLIALLGLAGIYSTLVTRTPKIARAAGVVGIVALASWTVMTVTQFLAAAGVVTSLGEVLPGVFFGVVLASTILTYLLFGVGTLRVEGSPRTVGLIVLAPGGLTVALVVDSAITGVTEFDGFVIGTGLALSMLALGYRLRTWNRLSTVATSTADVAVR